MEIPKSISHLIRSKQVALFYGASALCLSFSQLFAGVFTVKWIAPEEMGIWQSGRLCLVYGFILLFGIVNGLSRELPFYLGRNDLALCKRLSGTSLFVVNVASTIVFAASAAFLIYYFGSSSALKWTVIAIAFLLPLSFYDNYFLVAYRSNDSFRALTYIQFCEAALTVLSIPLIFYFSYYGMLGRAVLISTCSGILLYLHQPFRAKPSFDKSAAKVLLKTGIPIFSMDYLKNAISTLDRVIILSLLGPINLGYYAVALMCFQMLKVVPKAFSQHTYPRMTFEFGRSGDPYKLWRMSLNSFLFSAVLNASVGLFAWFLIPFTVKLYAPAYIPGISAAQILLIAGVFEGSVILANVFWSMKAWRLMTTYFIISSLIGLVAPILSVLILGHSLTAVAWGVVGSGAFRIVFAVLMILSVLSSRKARNDKELSSIERPATISGL